MHPNPSLTTVVPPHHNRGEVADSVVMAHNYGFLTFRDPHDAMRFLEVRFRAWLALITHPGALLCGSCTHGWLGGSCLLPPMLTQPGPLTLADLQLP